MQIYLGETGLNATFQESFPKKVKCNSCGKSARIMFVAQEWDEKEYICNLHKNTGARKNGKFWPHDAISIANYLCEKCFKVTSILNQA